MYIVLIKKLTRTSVSVKVFSSIRYGNSVDGSNRIENSFCSRIEDCNRIKENRIEDYLSFVMPTQWLNG